MPFKAFYTDLKAAGQPIIMSEIAYKWISVLVALMVVPGTIVSPRVFNRLGLAGGCVLGNIITGTNGHARQRRFPSYGLTFPFSRRHYDNHPPVRRHGETAVDSNLRRLCRAPLCLLPFHGNIPAVDGTYAGGNEPARQERLLSGLQHHGDEFCGSLEPICARRDIGQLGWVPYLLAKGKPFLSSYMFPTP